MHALSTAPETRSSTDDAGDHILDERISPAERVVWTMLCGAQCVAFDDGSLAPDGVDFYLEADGHKATCKGCLAERALRATHRVTEVER